MKQIIIIFFLTLSFFLHGADFVSHPDMEQHVALRRLVRYVNNKFKAAGKSVDVEIICSENSPPGEPQVIRSKGKWRLVINPFDDWQRDHDFCRKLITLLLCAKSGNGYAAISGLPDWFIYGISQVVRDHTSSARLIRNQYSFELLDMLCANGCFGDPLDVIRLKFADLPVEQTPFFLEYTKLIMLALDRARAVTRLSVMISEASFIDEKVFNEVALKVLPKISDNDIPTVYRREMWSDLVPPPEELTLNCLERISTLQIPELDSENIPTGRILSVKLEDLPTLSTRPDYVLLCRRAARALFVMSVGEARKVRMKLADLRYHFEQDINRDINRDASVPVAESGSRNAPDRKIPKKQTARKGAQDTALEFEKIMERSRDGNFRKNVQNFYRKKVLTREQKKGFGSRVAGAFGNIFASRTTLDGRMIGKTLKEIRELLQQRKAEREFLEAVNLKRFPVRKMLKWRTLLIREGDPEQAAWLSSVGEGY